MVASASGAPESSPAALALKLDTLCAEANDIACTLREWEGRQLVHMAAELLTIAAGRLESSESMGTGEQTHALIGATKALADKTVAPQDAFDANAIMDRLMRNFSIEMQSTMGNKIELLRSIKDARLFAITFVDSLPQMNSLPSFYADLDHGLAKATSGRMRLIVPQEREHFVDHREGFLTNRKGKWNYIIDVIQIGITLDGHPVRSAEVITE